MWNKIKRNCGLIYFFVLSIIFTLSPGEYIYIHDLYIILMIWIGVCLGTIQGVESYRYSLLKAIPDIVEDIKEIQNTK